MLKFNLIAIGMTIGIVVGGTLAIALIAVLPPAIQLLKVGSATKWLLLGGVVILLTWLYLSALMVLLGAVINAQSERQTRKDSTEGPPWEMGGRGAHAADTLGGSTDEDNAMAEIKEVGCLKRRLHWESAGPLADPVGLWTP